LANAPRNNLQIQISGVELSTLFGHSDGWAQGMIAWPLDSRNNENPIAHGRPNVITSDQEKRFTQSCLVREFEKNSVSAQDAIGFIHDNRVQIDRFSVGRFIEHLSETLTFQQAQLSDKGRQEISENNWNHYFHVVMIQL
jgi:hypothetical protein